MGVILHQAPVEPERRGGQVPVVACAGMSVLGVKGLGPLGTRGRFWRCAPVAEQLLSLP